MLIALLAVLAAASARAHGTLPTSNSIAFGPGTGVFLGTNFGGIVHEDGGELRFVCELLVTGEQQSVDRWLWLGSGAIAGAVTQGGLIRGVFASDPSACAYGTVPGTEAYLITDLFADPADASAFYAMGQGDDAAVLLHGTPGVGAEVVLSRPGAEALAVRAAGERVVATFHAGDSAAIISIGVDGEDEHLHALAPGERLRPLGLDAASDAVWFTQSSEAAEVVVKSPDAGATLNPVLTLDSRIGGFAIDGETVWLQGARAGVYRSDDGGEKFDELAASPHGSCLALAGDGRLFACGVPWQDGFALGVSADGKSFGAEIPYFDGIVGAITCPAAPEATTTCDGELQFLREYYGFSDPSTIGDGGPEVGPESAEPAPESAAESEPGAEVAEVAESGAEVERPKASDDGCGAGAPSALALVLLGLVRQGTRSTRRLGRKR